MRCDAVVEVESLGSKPLPVENSVFNYPWLSASEKAAP
jgi:hypothetical protein